MCVCVCVCVCVFTPRVFPTSKSTAYQKEKRKQQTAKVAVFRGTRKKNPENNRPTGFSTNSSFIAAFTAPLDTHAHTHTHTHALAPALQRHDETREIGTKTCMSHEEEDTCMSYEEEDTCMSYEEREIGTKTRRSRQTCKQT